MIDIFTSPVSPLPDLTGEQLSGGSSKTFARGGRSTMMARMFNKRFPPHSFENAKHLGSDGNYAQRSASSTVTGNSE